MSTVPTSPDGRWHYLITHQYAGGEGSTGFIVDDPIYAGDIPALATKLACDQGLPRVLITNISILAGPENR